MSDFVEESAIDFFTYRADTYPWRNLAVEVVGFRFRHTEVRILPPQPDTRDSRLTRRRPRSRGLVARRSTEEKRQRQ